MTIDKNRLQLNKLVEALNATLDLQGIDDYYVEVLDRPQPEDLEIIPNMGVHGVTMVDLLDREARLFRYGSDVETI
jgi:hypothetical protein